MQRIRPIAVTPLQDAVAEELRRRESARYLHRLQAVLLVSAGRSCSEVALWFECSPRTIERWSRAYDAGGVGQLRLPHGGGRPASLSSSQKRQLQCEIGQAPAEQGYRQRHWSGKLLSLHLERNYGLVVSQRHCQRMLKCALAALDDATAATPDMALSAPADPPGR